jgi:enamine deaminase RidA (YjgF/YER057c/UK114 family)
MQNIQHIQSDNRMSQLVISGNTAYLSGQVGNAHDDICSQVRTALEKVDQLLEKAGADKSRIVQATLWLADINDFDAMNSEWETWLDGLCPPARATGQVTLADPGYKFEVIIVAAL